jgi:hypothetical protein
MLMYRFASIRFSLVSTASALTRRRQLLVFGKMRDIGAAADFLVEALEHVRAFQVLVMLARQAEECQCWIDVLFGPAGEPGIAGRPFGQPCGKISPCFSQIAPVIQPSELLQAVAVSLHLEWVCLKVCGGIASSRACRCARSEQLQ